MNLLNIEIPAFDDIHVLVVGDVMLDRYWTGDASRISPEAPVPVVHVQEVTEGAGGAGNVALNLKALGCPATVISVIGDDEAGQRLEALLAEAGVIPVFHRQMDWPTITKLRVLGHNQQLIRLDFENDASAVDTRAMLETYKTQLSKHQAVIISDYGKGALQDVRELIALASQANIPILVDPKSRDFDIYQGATVVTPNLKEFEAVVGSCLSEQDMVEKGYALLARHAIHSLLITRGEKGMSLLSADQEPLHLPTRAQEVYDVTGAGDTVIAVLTACMAAGLDQFISARLANFGAGVVVRKLGAATVSVPELRRALQRQFKSEIGVLDENDLLVTVHDARAHGESIVITNGCFDILHAGHVAYLEQAKSLGKRLIVAVNSDESVRRLKGKGRPINSLEHRMAVVAALRAVDWVVPFHEDTPERLIQRVSPDVLVKGGDYKVDEIAGSKHVLANSGQVKILDFVDDCSTTAVLTKIRDLDVVEIDAK